MRAGGSCGCGRGVELVGGISDNQGSLSASDMGTAVTGEAREGAVSLSGAASEVWVASGSPGAKMDTTAKPTIMNTNTRASVAGILEPIVFIQGDPRGGCPGVRTGLFRP